MRSARVHPLVTALALALLAAACNGDDPAPTPTPTPPLSLEIAATIPPQGDHRAMAAMEVDPSTGTIWVWASCAPACGGEQQDELWGIPRGATEIGARIPLGALGCAQNETTPALAIDPDAARAYLTTCDAAGYVIADLRGNAFVARAPLEQVATALAVGSGRLYLSTEPGVLAIDPVSRTVTGTVDAGNAGELLVLANGVVVVGNLSESKVTFIDPAALTVAGEVDVPQNANCLAANARTNSLYVNDGLSEQVVVVDTTARTVRRTVDIGVPACEFAVDENIETVFAMNRRSPTIVALHARSLEERITTVIGRGPLEIAVDDVSHRLAVVHLDGTISLIAATVGVTGTPVRSTPASPTTASPTVSPTSGSPEPTDTMSPSPTPTAS